MMEEVAVPILRSDLELLPGELDRDGSDVWMLHDPLANRFFRLGRLDVAILAELALGDFEQIAQKVSRQLNQPVSPDEVKATCSFLRNNHLVQADEAQYQSFHHQAESKPPFFQKILKTYLFVRIPLLKPDPFLTRTLPWVSWLGSKAVGGVLLLALIAGLVMLIREFDRFITTFQYFFNAQGLAAYALTLLVIKLLHELGHAYVAKAKGCRVPVMGVAFLVGWPVLYTDTSDAWRVQAPKDRMSIGIAGVATELAVAILALFAWGLTSEGIWNSVFFLLASTTWLLSVLVNFNPLMRFDGYYLLSDYLRVPNMEARSFAMSRWWLREKLFGFGEEPPERIQRKLVVYAFSVWIYRFLLFLGIALLVYYFFFKVLGIFLFVVEIIYFILRPIWNELKEWRRRQSELRWNRATIRSSVLLILLMGLLLIPWRSSVELPAMLQGQYVTLYAPYDGRLVSANLAVGQTVSEGEQLFRIDSPALEHELEDARLHQLSLKAEQRASGFDRRLRENTFRTQAELVTQIQLVHSLEERQKTLEVEAPSNGFILDVPEDIAEGAWLAEGEPVLALLNSSELELTGYLSESRLMRLSEEQTGYFYPEGGRWPVLAVRVREIENSAIRQLDQFYPASLFGGDLPVRESQDSQNGSQLIPVEGTYRVFFEVAEQAELPEQTVRGTVVIAGEAESFLAGWVRKAVAVLNREAGF